jgi:predicted dehydrogenase
MTEKTIGAAILGTGFARTTQIPCLQSTPGMRVVGLYSRSRARAEEIAREFAIPVPADDADALLGRDDVDVVFVSTPPHLHLPLTLAALRAGKHVVCEKPTALHAGEAAEMLAAARAAGRIHLIDHELRMNPRRRRIVELVREGFVGPVISVEYRSAGAYRLDPDRPWSWWSDASKGGGVLGAIGSHAIDSIRSWVGEIAEVRGNLATHVTERPHPETSAPTPVTADDFACVWGRLAQGGEVVITLLAAAREEPAMDVRIHGEKGSLRLDSANRLWRRAHGEPTDEEAAVPDAPPPPAGSRIPDTPWARAFVLLAAALRDAIRDGKPTVPGAATFEDGLRNQQVIDAARESARRADWVAVDGLTQAP